MACEFIAASRKLAAQGFTEADAWKRLADYLAIFDLKLPAATTLERARQLHFHKTAFWDALIIAACQEYGIHTLYSEDIPGRSIDSLRIVNPYI